MFNFHLFQFLAFASLLVLTVIVVVIFNEDTNITVEGSSTVRKNNVPCTKAMIR